MKELIGIDVLGNSSIGIFATASNSFALFPSNTKSKVIDTARTVLQVPIIQTTLVNCSLLGLFAVGNSNHLLLPDLVHDDEYDKIKNNLPDDVQIGIIDSKITALGNAIVASDKLALVHSEFPSNEKELIANLLDVEVISQKIMDVPLVGSLIFRNNNGLLTHPLIIDEELNWLQEIFKVKSDVVTVNRGMPHPRPGIVGNDKGILVGSDTSGPELMRIFEMLLSN